MSIWAVLDPPGRLSFLDEQAQAGRYAVHYSIYSTQEPEWSTDPAQDPRRSLGFFPETRVNMSVGVRGDTGSVLEPKPGASIGASRSIFGSGSALSLPAWVWWALLAFAILAAVGWLAGPSIARAGVKKAVRRVRG